MISKKRSKEPFNRLILDKFIKARSEYKKECRKAEKQYRQFLTKKLIDLEQCDPKSFWNLIGKMNDWGKEKNDPVSNIPADTWMKHFQILLNDKSSQFGHNTEDQIRTFDPTLDGIISKKELGNALERLKNDKAPGPDKIPGEYLKVFGRVAENTVLKIVNTLFSNHIYPSAWTRNFLKAIYKKLDVKAPGNYRGLAIGSAFAKLFSFILLNRLNGYIEKEGLVSPNQIGFMKGCRTSDHIFLLKTLITKTVKKNGKVLFAAFIDFKKAYDTVDRSLLIKRIQDLGINGIFLKNLESMYKKTEYLLQYKNGHLDPISSNLGLKQGCPLSPMLFNLYIDDVCEIFDNDCDPLPLRDKLINHFLYADDLVLLSQTKEGLQRCIDKLHAFAEKKHLSISIDKSKTMLFNKTGRLTNHSFNVNGEKLEHVQTFCYLGYELNSSGTNNYTINTLYEKAAKAMRPIQRTIARFNIPIKTSFSFSTHMWPQ